MGEAERVRASHPGEHKEEGPILHARLLGGVELRLGEADAVQLDSARAESLLAYLLLHRHAPQQRQHLAFTLWPDSTESQARTNLRHVLHNLRRALPDANRFIEAGPRMLRWRPEAPLWLDVAAFEQAVQEGRLEDAVATYTGDLLEGNYDEWVLEERERLSRLYLDALERRARELEAWGNFAEAIRYAERLLRQEPLREETYRLLLRLRDASGDRAAALRTYHACATTLVRELGVEPSAATRQSYEALLEAAPEPAEGPGMPARPPLIGRRAERARLAALWQSSEAGRAQLVLVTGEAGIGKSRLIEELRSWCAHRGARIAESRSYAAEGSMAYGALVAWLRSEPIAARLRRVAPAHVTELARLLPELLTEVPGLPAPEPLAEDEQRQRLFAAAGQAIVSAGAPLLLVAEDLHWCDAQTLRFVHYLLRAEPEGRLLVAASARREELDTRGPVRELVDALRALGVVSEVSLSRLSPEETVLLAERLTDRPLTEDEAKRFYEESEGVPLFLVEALRAEAEPATAPTGEMSERVRAVIDSRLARLSDPAAELVGVAATIGREFTTEVLADASQVDEEAMLRGLDELWRRAIVRARGANGYDFSHGKIREAAYGALSPAAARHHHLRVAETLQRSHAEDLDAVSAQIASHYEAAGAIEEAIGWHAKAADAAQRLYASADAVRHLERALGLVGGLPAGKRDALELGLLTKLPAPLLAVEGYLSGRVAEVHERARDLAGSLAVELEAPLIRSLALASLARGEFEAGREFGDQLRARGEREGDDVLRVEGGYVLGIAAYWRGELAVARSHFRDAIERCRPEQRSARIASYGQDPEIVCLTRLAHTLWLLGDEEEAERARDLGLELAEERGHPYSRAIAGVFAGMLALDQRDEQRLRRHADEFASIDYAYEAPQIRIVADLFAGLLDVLGGQATRGAEQVQSMVANARRDEPATPGFHALLMRILLEAYVAAGEAQAGLAATGEALEMGGGAQLWEAEIRRLRSEFLSVLGATRAEVEAELGRAVEVARRQGARAFERRAAASRDRLLAGTR
ncbi:MAG TPA: BTAD domain-containing putative transcriptional regulator [Thermoleophilaceae bacterium]|nr:BTAD domain-containing putative transcriptional regulator [Thermoleophilaceae bacterium]